MTGVVGGPAAATGRPGISLVEVLVAMGLAGVVLSIASGVLSASNRIARLHAERVALGEAARVPAVVLAREVRRSLFRADWAAVASDSIVFRVYRGGGLVCGASGDDVLVRYRGVRAPNPDKDSVLILSPSGAETVAALERSRRDAGCPDAEGAVYALAVDNAPRVGTPVLVFEFGSYHLAGDAFRYRRGAGGRQPMTTERIDDARSAFSISEVDGGPVLNVRIVTRPAAGSDGTHPTGRVRVPLLNPSPEERS